MRAIMAAASCGPAVASHRAKRDGDFRVPTFLDEQLLDAQFRDGNRTKGGRKPAHGRLQSTLPVRAKTRRRTITPNRPPGLLCQSSPGRRQTAILNL
jgi:hypothetical protein